jgi:crotonobetainyl-CoA:carnitine CoA-transferase CaiB-like acyl-CoA transferase
MLSDIVVLDLSELLPGPFCTSILANLGAKVIKIERPGGGDPARFMAPWIFNHVNCNKKSITLNLKEESGRDLFFQLARKSDAIIEGFRPDVKLRLGIDYKQIKEINPSIVYCSVSGYGQDGPYCNLPGHDLIYMGVAGVLDICGAAGPPEANYGMPVADLCSGMYAVVSILAAIWDAKKSGLGQYIDVSITDSVFSWMGVRIAEYLMRGELPKDRLMGRGAYGIFKAGDEKYFTLGAFENHFWKRLCMLLGLEELAGDLGLATWENRCEKSEEINRLLQEIFLQKGRLEWLEMLGKEDIPCGPVNCLEDLVFDPQLLARGLIEKDSGLNVPVRCSMYPAKFSKDLPSEKYPPPSLGEHNAEIYSSMIGLNGSEVEKLRMEGII